MGAEREPRHVLGVLVSGGGSNFRAIDEAIREDRIPNARIGALITDNPTAGAIKLAAERDIPAFILSNMSNQDRNAAIVDIFRDKGVVMGIGAGYLKLVGGEVINSCPLGVLNIHPAPLPRFGGKGMHGLNVHKAVIDSGVRWSGPTVHLMDEAFDRGQILAHRPVPVQRGDTPKKLAARILPVEHALYPQVIAQQLAIGPHPELVELPSSILP